MMACWRGILVVGLVSVAAASGRADVAAGALLEAAGAPLPRSGRFAADAEAAELRCDPAAALPLYLQASAAKPNDAYLLQKVAQQYSDLVEAQPNDEVRREYARKAVEYSKRAVALAPDNAVDVLSVAVAQGKLALYSDMKTKVGFGRQIHDETLHAIELDPNYAWAHDVLGQWDYAVAALNSTERFFLKMFFGGLPSATPAEGIAELTKATELEPGELTHWIELGFAYRAAGKPKEARAAIEHGMAMPATKIYHPKEIERGRAALAKLPPG